MCTFLLCSVFIANSRVLGNMEQLQEIAHQHNLLFAGVHNNDDVEIFELKLMGPSNGRKFQVA